MRTFGNISEVLIFAFILNISGMAKKTTGFILSLVITFILSTLSINLDISQFIQRKEINIPDEYFYIVFSVDAIMVLSLILIFFYRKIGVFVFPFSVFIHFILYNFYLSTFLYFDLLVIFLYFSLILLVCIPRWESFK